MLGTTPDIFTDNYIDPTGSVFVDLLGSKTGYITVLLFNHSIRAQFYFVDGVTFTRHLGVILSFVGICGSVEPTVYTPLLTLLGGSGFADDTDIVKSHTTPPAMI